MHRPAERLLHVDVLAGVHRGRRNHRVHVIGRGDDDRVDVLLLVEHLAVVPVPLHFRQLLVDESLQRVVRGHLGPFRVRGLLRIRRPEVFPRGRCGRPVLACHRWRGGRFGPLLELPVNQTVVDVTDGDDVLGHDVLGVGPTLAVDADRRDVHQITWRRHALAQHAARHDHESGAGDCGAGLHELSTRHAGLGRRTRRCGDITIVHHDSFRPRRRDRHGTTDWESAHRRMTGQVRSSAESRRVVEDVPDERTGADA